MDCASPESEIQGRAKVSAGHTKTIHEEPTTNMVSKNLTEDGQRKKWYTPRKETLENKSFELVDLCQAEVALFIQPYGEDNMFIFRSRPDFPEAASVRAFPGY
jgi:hypothetical protein